MSFGVGNRITLYIVAGAIVASLMFYAFGRIDAILGVHDAAIVASSREALKLHPVLVAQRAKLRRIEGRWVLAVDSLTRLAQRADSADSAAAVAAGKPIPPPSPWRPVAQGCSIIRITCEQRAQNAENEAESLTKQLKAQVTVRDRRCGIFAGAGVSGGWKAGAGATLGLGCRLFP